MIHKACDESLELHCECKDPPDAQIYDKIQWSKIDKHGHETAVPESMIINNVIVIQQLHPSNSGLYKCSVTDHGHTDTRLVAVEVEPCDVSVNCACIDCQASGRILKIGQEVELRCKAGSEYGVRYNWKFNGNPQNV